MTDFHFSGQPLDNDLIASVSHVLHTGGVPNLLWGNYLLTVYGVPTIVDVRIPPTYHHCSPEATTNFYCPQDAAFIVPDTLIESAYTILADKGFIPCAPSFNCARSHTRRCPPPTNHLHIDDNLAVSLHRKSDILWAIPDLEDIDLSGGTDPHVMLACDRRLPRPVPGRGRGRFSSALDAVWIPSAVRYCEALIILLCRDYGSAYEDYWVVLLTYMLEFVDGTELLDEDRLGEEYRSFYRALGQADPKMYTHLDALRQDLSKGGILSTRPD